VAADEQAVAGHQAREEDRVREGSDAARRDGADPEPGRGASHRDAPSAASTEPVGEPVKPLPWHPDPGQDREDAAAEGAANEQELDAAAEEPGGEDRRQRDGRDRAIGRRRDTRAEDEKITGYRDRQARLLHEEQASEAEQRSKVHAGPRSLTQNGSVGPRDARRLAASADHGILGTHRSDASPDLVPVCFAIDGDRIGIPIDDVKPKATTRLQRELNLERDARATLLVEHWDAADWARLWWVRFRLERSAETPAAVHRIEARLRRRYRQYADTTFVSILTFRITGVSGWAASPRTS
jgi:hypothetical protein